MGKWNLENLVNLGSWPKYRKLSTYRKSKKENKENVRNHVRGDIQFDSTYRITLNWIPSLLLWVPRVKERGSTNQSVHQGQSCQLMRRDWMESWLFGHQRNIRDITCLPERIFWKITTRDIIIRVYLYIYIVQIIHNQGKWAWSQWQRRLWQNMCHSGCHTMWCCWKWMWHTLAYIECGTGNLMVI